MLGQRSIEHHTDSMLPYCSTDEDEILVALRAAAAGPDPVQTYAAAFFGMLPRFLDTIDLGKVEALATRFVANQDLVHADDDLGTERRRRLPEIRRRRPIRGCASCPRRSLPGTCKGMAVQPSAQQKSRRSLAS